MSFRWVDGSWSPAMFVWTGGAGMILRECLASRETGLPRVGVVSTEVTAGAAGTIANNLAALGAGRVAVLGVVGEDGFGWELDGALRGRGIYSGVAHPVFGGAYLLLTPS